MTWFSLKFLISAHMLLRTTRRVHIFQHVSVLTLLHLTSPGTNNPQLLREQLRERHEEHEKGLMEHLKSKARASKANLQRRRDHRRSISQGPAAVHLLSCSPARVPQSPAQPQTVARTEGVGGTESGGLGEGTSVDSESSTSEHAPDLAVYKKMLKVNYYKKTGFVRPRCMHARTPCTVVARRVGFIGEERCRSTRSPLRAVFVRIPFPFVYRTEAIICKATFRYAVRATEAHE